MSLPESGSFSCISWLISVCWLQMKVEMPAVSHPFALLAELTYRCPLKCPYCSNPLELRLAGDELDTAAWKRVLTEAAALGVIQIHFTGGEPLVRRDLEELVSHA